MGRATLGPMTSRSRKGRRGSLPGHIPLKPNKPWLRLCDCDYCRFTESMEGEACSWCGGIHNLLFVETIIDGIIYRDPACPYCVAWLRRVGPDSKPTERHIPISERTKQAGPVRVIH